MKTIITLLFLFLIPKGLSGQLIPVSNQYVLNPLTINPAYAGNSGSLNIAAFYGRQWVGINGAPETVTLALDAPFFDSKLGLGLIISNNKIGVTKETNFGTSYAFKIDMGKGNLSLGLGAGAIITNTAWSDLSVADPGDEYYLINSRVFVVPDFKFGAYFSYKNFFVGISIPELIGYRFDFNKDKYSMKFNPDQYSYLFNTGYVFSLSPKLKFFPSTLITFSQGEKLLYDVNANFIMFDRLWLGASYRDSRSVAGLLQFSINKQLRVAYTYNFDLNELRTYSNGSHEIMLRYQFSYTVNAINPLIF
jgi:type IX secretion system PorP/SprF family membrane protein